MLCFFLPPRAHAALRDGHLRPRPRLQFRALRHRSKLRSFKLCQLACPLRRALQYSRNTRFCMICNYVTKIIPALQSRCTKFRFAPLQSSQVRSRVDHVIAAERIDITPGGVDALLELGNGDMRRILNVLQATAVAAAARISSCTGRAQVKAPTASASKAVKAARSR